MLKKNKNRILLLTCFFWVALISCNQNLPNQNGIESTNDSINYYLKHNKNLSKAKALNDLIHNDSLKKVNVLKIAFQAFKNSDSLLFKTANEEAVKLSVKLEDSMGIAETHWNSGSFYARQEKLDSAYYHYFQAHKYYSLIESENYAAKMLYNMAFIQSRLKDYTSSESKLFQAISTYKRLGKNLALYRCYNALGNNYSELGDFENSIEYHNKSIKVLQNLENKKSYYERSLNDIGLLYQTKKEYPSSIQTFDKALNNSNLKILDIHLYARLIDNLAYSKLLNGDTLGIEKDLMEALKIRDSLNNISGITINKIHLAKYYFKIGDTLHALEYADSANELANKSKNNNDILTSLLLLSRIDKVNSSHYLKKHVELTESLQRYERTLKNKFARIQFETDEYIEKSEKLALQKTLILTFGFAIVSILILLYLIKVQRSKNKELQQEQLQQQANEQIYKLMLKQQSKLEEGRLKERHRVSEELHDGVLGKIFGTRMGLGFLELNGESHDLEKHQKYIHNLREIEEEIRDISHELKNEILSSNADYISLIKDLVEEKSVLGNFEYFIDSEDSFFWNDSNETIKINIYRIVQEALQNIIKYSKANQVSLLFKYNNENLVVVIRDDGVGFNITNAKKGIGLMNIKSRTESLRGKVKIMSEPNNGTVIEIKIPYNI
ncbi:tetratricopeptide repeat protein [Winogradskyella undariae]|uniref:tetratricopeptide repeat-containing sensor histidine kinase n=1 Tax=Winogradskyella undariae TaxID=1285465 RepID=UPI00156B33F6|nr:tetratricopeptide repeat-containing sensor histidine kinase [Winogradskyella undariae]NRR93127.1 tetratricopeptide repeat protein [Winogradskyella undariae]